MTLAGNPGLCFAGFFPFKKQRSKTVGVFVSVVPRFLFECSTQKFGDVDLGEST